MLCIQDMSYTTSPLVQGLCLENKSADDFLPKETVRDVVWPRFVSTGHPFEAECSLKGKSWRRKKSPEVHAAPPAAAYCNSIIFLNSSSVLTWTITASQLV